MRAGGRFLGFKLKVCYIWPHYPCCHEIQILTMIMVIVSVHAEWLVHSARMLSFWKTLNKLRLSLIYLSISLVFVAVLKNFSLNILNKNLRRGSRTFTPTLRTYTKILAGRALMVLPSSHLKNSKDGLLTYFIILYYPVLYSLYSGVLLPGFLRGDKKHE